MRYLKIILILVGITILISFGNCKTGSKSNQEQLENHLIDSSAITPAIEKVNFYIESSGSMGPYFHSVDSELKTTLISLSNMTEFMEIPKSYHFIDGNETIHLGDAISEVEDFLTYRNFNSPTSDLTLMFKEILRSVPNEISILVTDALYDLTKAGDNDLCKIDKPLERLKQETSKLQSMFFRKLDTVNFQTAIIKAKSSYSGVYYYATKPGKCEILLKEQLRPYYYFVFGPSSFLNSSKLKADFEDLHHVSKLMSVGNIKTQIKIPYKVVTYDSSNNTRGIYRQCRSTENCIEVERTVRNSQGFDFFVETNFSDYPWQQDLFELRIDLYQTSNPNFSVTEVASSSKSNFTHRIKISSESNNIYDEDLRISFPTCEVAPWIVSSSSEDELNITGDEETTWGLDQIVKSITTSYCNKNSSKPFFEFKLKIIR